MRVLFDHNLPRQLRNHLSPHDIVLTGEAGWSDLGNGQLLAAAQRTFDALLTTDTNIYHQQKVEQFDIAVIVLRAYNNKYEMLRPMAPDVLSQLETVEPVGWRHTVLTCTTPDVLSQLETVEPGKVYYIHVDEKLKESDRRKGKGPGTD